MTKRKAAKKEAPKAIPLIIMSNERSADLVQILQTFYQAVALGQIGLVMGMDPETGEVSPMLAGIDRDGEVIVGVFPLAKIMQDVQEIESILIPDGKGNYVSNTEGFTEPDDGLLDGETAEEAGQTVQ